LIFVALSMAFGKCLHSVGRVSGLAALPNILFIAGIKSASKLALHTVTHRCHFDQREKSFCTRENAFFKPRKISPFGRNDNVRGINQFLEAPFIPTYNGRRTASLSNDCYCELAKRTFTAIAVCMGRLLLQFWKFLHYL